MCLEPLWKISYRFLFWPPSYSIAYDVSSRDLPVVGGPGELFRAQHDQPRESPPEMEPQSTVSEEQHQSTPGKVMVIVAHPDDAEFSAAGTIAKWAHEGHEIVYVLCTSGDKGTSDRSIEPAHLAETRQAEQRNACRVL